MGPFPFLTPKIAIVGLVVLGAGDAAGVTLVATHHTDSAARPTAVVSLAPRITPPDVLHTVTAITPDSTETPAAATPTAPVAATPAPTSAPPTAPPGGPPVITSLTVSPDTWETWDQAPDARCHTGASVTPSSTTYAYLLATVSAPYGVHDVTGEYSFTGNSSATFPLDLNYGSTNQWSTEIGGYLYKNYNGGSDIVGVEKVTYTVHVTDSHGTTVTSSVTNNLHECDPSSLTP